MTQPTRERLSPRQHQIIALVAAGNSTPQIAVKLHLSPATVKSHLEGIFERFGVHDRAHAVAEAFRAGVLS